MAFDCLAQKSPYVTTRSASDLYRPSLMLDSTFYAMFCLRENKNIVGFFQSSANQGIQDSYFQVLVSTGLVSVSVLTLESLEGLGLESLIKSLEKSLDK